MEKKDPDGSQELFHLFILGWYLFCLFAISWKNITAKVNFEMTAPLHLTKQLRQLFLGEQSRL